MKRTLLIALLCTLGCSPYQKYFRYSYEAEQTKAIRSVVITPIDMIRALPQGSNTHGIRRLEKRIENHLRSSGYEVLPNGLLAKNWVFEVEKVDGFFDPTTGRIDASKIARCLANAIEKTRENQDIDGVVFVQIIERPAKMVGDRVYWDGCARRIFDSRGDIVSDVSWRGEMKALSLQVQLFDKQHNLVFQNIGGIEFPFELVEEYAETRLEWKKELRFRDEEVEEGARIALHPLVHYGNYPKEPRFYE